MKSPKPLLSQGIMIILLSIGIINHVFIIPVLLQTTRRDSWIAVIISAAPLLLMTYMVYFIAKQMQDKSIEMWIKDQAGKVTANIFRILMSIYLFSICFFTLTDTTKWAKITFLSATPIFVTSLILLVLCYYACIKGFKTIATASGILLPIVVALGFFIMFTNIQYKDYSQLLPLFENGWASIAKGVMYACSGSFEIILYLMLQPKLEKPAKGWQLLVLALVLIGLTLGPLVGAITIFNPIEAERQRYPAYEEWRIATLGRYIAQTDFFSIYQWLSGAFIRITLALYLIVDIWNIKKKKARIWTLAALMIFLYVINLLGPNDILFLHLLKDYYFPASFVFLIVLVIALFILAYISSRKKVHQDHGT
ncbi:endospore germination permease [Paenibacillus sp. HJL G12]|uniref:Endospore germination permease n=1 Tax=Paenibacillus dendrobii TaxID=2691084 RepID=A0A7X3IFX3_9BACL|nr:endospore germination permease [Paenibacillus dendrobii]MWV43184.1 endospore germination permease [Paenibacillus dendrobii]